MTVIPYATYLVLIPCCAMIEAVKHLALSRGGSYSNTGKYIWYLWSTKKNEMGGNCSAYGGQESLIQGFGGET